MRAALFHNPLAGNGEVSTEELLAAFADIGWDCALARSLEEALAKDVLVAVGGDGTVGAAAKRAVKRGALLVPIPSGTANNIARSLGLIVGDPIAAIQRLRSPREAALDLGALGRAHFVEAFGVGAFAELLRAHEMHEAEHVASARRVLAAELRAYEPREVTMEIDGRVIAGRYLLCAVMNTRSFGPALELTPDARMDDGLLDVALVSDPDMLEGPGVLRVAARHRGASVRVRAKDTWAHIDDAPRALAPVLEVAVRPRALRVLLPSA